MGICNSAKNGPAGSLGNILSEVLLENKTNTTTNQGLSKSIQISY